MQNGCCDAAKSTLTAAGRQTKPRQLIPCPCRRRLDGKQQPLGRRRPPCAPSCARRITGYSDRCSLIIPARRSCGGSTVYMTARPPRPTVRHAAADRFLTSCDRWYPDGCGQARGWSSGKHYLPAAAAAAAANASDLVWPRVHADYSYSSEPTMTVRWRFVNTNKRPVWSS